MELLAAKSEHQIQDMQRIQHDTKSLYGERITPLLLSDAALATGLSAEADKLVAALQAWDFECPTGFDNSDPQNPVPSAARICQRKR